MAEERAVRIGRETAAQGRYRVEVGVKMMKGERDGD